MLSLQNFLVSFGLLPSNSATGYSTNNADYFVRTANEFLLRGLNVVLSDSAPAFPNGLSLTDRLSGTHASQLQGLINAANTRWNLPVWVVGYGDSSISAVTASGFQPSLTGVAGLIKLSPTTVLSGNPTNQTTLNAYVSANTKPALVLWHVKDLCTLSPPSGSSILFAAIPSPIEESQAFDGGHSVVVDACGPGSCPRSSRLARSIGSHLSFRRKSHWPHRSLQSQSA